VSNVVSPVDLETWKAGFDDLFDQIGHRFGRIEPRLQARAYLRGLLAPVERKNSWQLAEAAGQRTPDRMQRLLRAAVWDPDLIRDDVRAYVARHLGDRNGVLIVDETGFVKRGNRSAGVQRQYSGTAGRVENCQLAVFCAYATDAGHALIDRDLYLPKSWTEDPARRDDAGIPADYAFATKPILATRMLARALDAGVPAAWVTADEAYGHDSKFRYFLAARRIGYVVAIPRSQPIHNGAGSARADSLVAGAPAEAWKRLSAGEGSKGERLYDWAMASLPGHADRHDQSRWLLARRSISDPDELAFYLCSGPDETTIDTLVRVAGHRWAIETCFKDAKNETGLDHYQVRRYDGWYRHITLSMLAYAYLAVTAAADPKAATTWSPSARQRSAVSWYT
jgi:SRSO17 transposase